MAAPRVSAAPAHSRLLAQQRLTLRSCCLQPALLFLRLHNAELPLRWERRSWDTCQGAGPDGEQGTHPGEKEQEREVPLLPGRLQQAGTVGEGGGETLSPARAARAGVRAEHLGGQ